VHGKNNYSKASAAERVTFLTSSIKNACLFCNDAHALYNCSTFLVMPPDERIKEARHLKVCLNCLKSDHFMKNCKHGSCRECSGRHNTLLHQFTSTANKEAATNTKEESSITNDIARASCHTSQSYRGNILMATAIVNASNQDGHALPIRVLLDSGSEANFISQSVCNRLGLRFRFRATSEIVAGVNDAECQVCQVTNVTIKSKHSNFQINVQCLVIPKIAKDLPSKEIDKNGLSIQPNVQLADIDFNKRNPIDVLIGAEFFFDLLVNGKHDLGENGPILQNTKLGWIVAGPVCRNKDGDDKESQVINVLHSSLKERNNLDQTLKQFWEIESVTEIPIRNVQE